MAVSGERNPYSAPIFEYETALRPVQTSRSAGLSPSTVLSHSRNEMARYGLTVIPWGLLTATVIVAVVGGSALVSWGLRNRGAKLATRRFVLQWILCAYVGFILAIVGVGVAQAVFDIPPHGMGFVAIGLGLAWLIGVSLLVRRYRTS